MALVLAIPFWIRQEGDDCRAGLAGDAPIVELLFPGSDISGGGDAHGLLTDTLGNGLSLLE